MSDNIEDILLENKPEQASEEQKVPKKILTKQEKTIKARKEKILKAVKKIQRKNKKQRMTQISKKKIKELEIEQMKPDCTIKGVGAPRRISPDMEKVLFPYYVAGASLSQIHRQFCKELGMSLDALYNARDYYKWEQRMCAIRNLVNNDTILKIADKFKDYLNFFDDLVSDAIIRFNDNSVEGRNSNPFNTLKISNMGDLKTVVELMMNISNGGVKRHAVAIKGDIKHEVEHKDNYTNLSEKKAGKLLEILASEDDDIDDAEIKDIEKE